MKTQIKKNGDTVVVEMKGRLDYETNVPLREDLRRILKSAGLLENSSKSNKTDNAPKKIIFDLENLDFVGSSGISGFIQTLKDFNSSITVKPKYCNVKSEFKRVMKAFDESEIFEFYDNQDKAKKSYDQ